MKISVKQFKELTRGGDKWDKLALSFFIDEKDPDLLEYISEEERQKRLRELEIIRGILTAVLTIIITGVAIWALPA